MGDRKINKKEKKLFFTLHIKVNYFTLIHPHFTLLSSMYIDILRLSFAHRTRVNVRSQPWYTHVYTAYIHTWQVKEKEKKKKFIRAHDTTQRAVSIYREGGHCRLFNVENSRSYAWKSRCWCTWNTVLTTRHMLRHRRLCI